MGNDELYNRIVDEFYNEKSIAEIAKDLGTTRVKVQRVLITERLWSSNRTRQIASLREEGKSIAEIAEILGKDEKTIQTFLPYSRGQYGSKETNDSIKSKDYRDRMKTAVSNMHKEEKNIAHLMVPDVLPKEADFHEPTIETAAESFNEKNNIYRLHLELVQNPSYTDNDMGKLGLHTDEEKEFLNFARAKEGIIREVLVPGKMTLHAMHYMLQILFGWQNSHLHRYCLPEKMFSFLTNDTYSNWADLCGTVFRFPEYAPEDMCWDDDYTEGKSFKTWLKKKYTNCKPSKAVCDNYFYNCMEIEKTAARFASGNIKNKLDEIITENVKLDDLRFSFEGDFTDLIESLTIGELFNTTDSYNASWITYLTQEQLVEGQNRFSNVKNPKLEKLFDELVKWRVSEATLGFYYYNDDKDMIREQTNADPDAVVAYHKRIIKSYERKLAKYLWRPQIKPFTKTIYYNYDFGDDWYLRISCEEIIPESRKGAIEVPCCTYVDGMNMVDDAGGINGFLDFLRTIHGDDPEEAQTMRTWAHGLGWNGKIFKPENLL